MKKAFVFLLTICILLCVDIANAGAKEKWNEYKQPGGGALSLLGDWSLVQLWGDVTQTQLNRGNEYGDKYYEQRLINAKRAYNEVVCSVQTARSWYTDKKGKILIHKKKDLAKERTESVARFMLEKLPNASVSKVTSQKQKYGIVWRVEAVFNAGNSEILEAYTYYKGFVYRLSATHNISESKYWRECFEKALSLWKPSALVGETSASQSQVGDKQSDIWQEVAMQSAGTIYIPSSWVIIYKDSTIEVEATTEGDISSQVCLNARPLRLSPDESPIFQVYSMWNNKRLLVNNYGELGQIASEVINTILSAMKVPNIPVKQERYALKGQDSFIFTYEVNMIRDYKSHITWAVLRHENKILILQATYLQKNEEQWGQLIKSILRQWKVTT
jgi:hypothetical protein